MKYIIGVDFDNTIVNYDDLIYNVAVELGFIDRLSYCQSTTGGKANLETSEQSKRGTISKLISEIQGGRVNYSERPYQKSPIGGYHEHFDRNNKMSKKHIRDYIRSLEEGDIKWQKLQAIVYGHLIKEAKVIDGVYNFFNKCKKRNAKLYILSHKTEFAKYDPTKTCLRKTAMQWLEVNNFFNKLESPLTKQHVFFESSRLEKINRIQNLKCTHFIDDLEEIFKEKSFPKGVNKILFDPHGESKDSYEVKKFRNWDDINEYIFGD